MGHSGRAVQQGKTELTQTPRAPASKAVLPQDGGENPAAVALSVGDPLSGSSGGESACPE